MKLTVMNASGQDELVRAGNVAIAYINAGYADGSRPRQHDCALFSNSRDRTAAVWGGPDHIRVQFLQRGATGMKSALDILTEARGYVAYGWTQGAPARDINGQATHGQAREAVCWSPLGAIARTDNSDAAFDAVGMLREALNARSVTRWNNDPGRTQAEVLALFDKAIEAERAKA